MHVRKSRRNESGVAMLLALMTLLLVGGIATLLFTRSLNEMRHSADDTAIVQTLMLARGGANMGGALLSTDVHDAFRDIIEITATPGRWAFGNDTPDYSDDGPEPGSVISELAPAASMLQTAVDHMVCDQTFLPAGSSGAASVRIHFTEQACGEGLPPGISLPNGRYVSGPPRLGAMGVQEYSIPFIMISEASLQEHRRNIVTQGEYRFEVGQSSFAKYAYFTNRDSTRSNQIWFTDDTMIDGPVHTNGHFAFYKDPWFGGRVTSAGCENVGRTVCNSTPSGGAFFYDRPSRLRTVAAMRPNPENPNFSSNAPRLEAGVSWNAQFVPLPQNAFDQEAVAKGSGGRLDVGIHLNRDLASLDVWAADANGNSPAPTRSGGKVSWGPAATHQFVRSCHMESRPTGNWWNPYEDIRVCETWRIDGEKRLQKLDPASDFEDPSTWVWHTDSRPFNGVVYTAGKIDRLRGPERVTAGDGDMANDGTAAPPALAAFSEMTIVAEGNIRLTGDLTYEQPPCDGVPVRNGNRTVTRADCRNTDHDNVLGVYTPTGDIIIGNDNKYPNLDLNAPDNMHVHGVLMSASNQIRVEGYLENNRKFEADRGRFFLMGGMIQENRGVFGTFNAGSTGGRKGYDRVYTYDPRMSQGVAPPYFPTTGLDTVDAVRVFSFGQREQVY